MDNIASIINNLNYIKTFAEDYHSLFDGLHYWRDIESECDDYLKKRNTCLLWGIVLCIALPIVLFLSIKGFIVNMDEFAALKAVGFSLCFPLLPFSIYFLLRGSFFSAKKSKLKEKSLEKQAYYKKQIEYYKNDNKFSTHRSIYTTYFPDCKAREKDINYLVYVLETGRAFSFQEALKLLDEKKYNDETIAIAKETIEQIKRHTNTTTIVYR